MKKLLTITFLGIIVPVLLFAMIGCMKEPDHVPDYGPQVDLNDVQSAIDELNQADPQTIKKSEYSDVMTTLQIDTQPAQDFQRLTTTIINKTLSPDQKEYIFSIVERLIEYQYSPPKDTTTNTEATLPNPNAPASVTPESIALPLSKPYGSNQTISMKALQRFEETSPARVTYHNLSKEAGFRAIPSIVKMKEGCGGLLHCDRDLRTMTVKFDRVVWESPTRGVRTRFMFIVSPDVPFFSYQLLGCAQSFLDFQGRVVPVTQCDEVVDFTYGRD